MNLVIVLRLSDVIVLITVSIELVHDDAGPVAALPCRSTCGVFII